MRDIYLIDFENVASEGLSGITYLAPEDEVIIFYSNNSKSLSMKMHILIGKSVCKLDYFEATVGGKNALDHQISTWLGYLVGTHAAERNYYIVSRDMGYKFVASFWSESEQKPSVRCVESIKAAGRIERNRQQQREAAAARAAEAAAKQAQPAPQPVEEVPVQEVSPVQETVSEEIVMIVPVQAVEQSAPQSEEHVVPEPAAQPAEKPKAEQKPQSAEKPKAEQRPQEQPKAKQKPQHTEQNRAKQKSAPQQAEKPKAEQKPDQKGTKTAKKEESKLELTALIAPYPGLQEARLRELIAENKKQVLCNTLRKQLGQEKGLALYNAIKKRAWR